VFATSFAALSIWAVVTWSESRSFWVVSRVMRSFWVMRVSSLPSWKRSIRGLGIGRWKGGLSRVVGYVSTAGGWEVGSPMWGISARRALWSLYSVRSVVVVEGGSWGASFGMRISQ